MAFLCPNCSRNLGDSINPADPPVFCMYCGHRLRGSPSPAVTLAYQPSSLDSATQAYLPTAEGTTSPESVQDATIESTPSILGGYKLARLLGAGGMGQVYEAVHPSNGHRVAIKLLSHRLATNAASVERFRQEGRVASQISHPHCVFVLRADTDAGRPYIMMELMPGRTLKDLVDEHGPLSTTEAIRRILDVVDGLAEAHELGVIHRDVKPSNCFLTPDDRVKVGDFGLSKSLAPQQDHQHLTHSGAFLGTVLFASPEQIRGEPVSYDSDVYAVCATMYYLLMGRAPFQHESLTASLAKAVSEPPPPIRGKRPDVSPELERIILKGLDRDRQKRWSTLDELRHALEDVRPERQQPARPRLLVLAYLMDSVVLIALAIPVEILRAVLIGYDTTNFSPTLFSLPSLILTMIYFALFEGLLGWTPGKRILRLRVSLLEQTGPPGLKAALIRTVVFNLMWIALIGAPEWFVEQWPGGIAGSLLAVGSFVLAAAGLLIQLKRTPQGWRGLQDRFSGCRVTSRPFSNPPSSLESLYEADIWGRVQPSPIALPAEIGGFAVQHKLADLADGGMVWLAEDRSLGRRVLIHILPEDQTNPMSGETPLVRPHRLRILGHGRILWNGAPRVWIGYVAPAGVPLADCVSAERKLTWAQTRPLLEQLAQELESAEQEGRLPRPLSIDQVWVEANGRLQLLDFPLPGIAAKTISPTADTPMSLLRATATLALEGRARTSHEPIAAPIPPHAQQLLADFWQEKSASLSVMRVALLEDHQQPAVVTAGMRAGHLTLQATMLSLTMVIILASSLLLSLGIAIGSTQRLVQPQLLLKVLESPEECEQLRQIVKNSTRLQDRQKERLLTRLAPEQLNATQALVRRQVELFSNDLVFLNRTLIAPERKLLSSFQTALSEIQAQPEAEEVNLSFLSLILARAERADRPERDPSMIRAGAFNSIALVYLIFLAIWCVFAMLFRAGLSMRLAGLTLVTGTGMPLGRFWCLVRELVVWLPVLSVFLLAVWLQAYHPTMAQTRFVIWLMGVFVLGLYVIIAIRQPSQPPHDKLLGSHIVPI